MGDPAIDILSLCSGAAGLDLGVSIAEPGARTRCYVEWEAYAAAVLLARMEDQALEPAPVWCGDIRDFDARCFRGHIGMVVSGDPCQPNSVAGNRKGADDERWLLDRVLEIFDESGAPAFFRENVAGNTDGQLSVLVPALEGMGCRVAAGIFSAAGVGASHRRERLFVLAHRGHTVGRAGNAGGHDADGADAGRPQGDGGAGERGQDVAHRAERGFGEFGGAQEPGCGGHADGGEPAMDNPASPRRGTGQPGEGGPLRDEAWRAEPDGRCTGLADASGNGSAAGLSGQDAGKEGQPGIAFHGGYEIPLHTPGPADPRWPAILSSAPHLEPAICRVASKLAYRVDRLRLCGNGCHPLQVAHAYRTLSALLADAAAAEPVVRTV